jgi:SAM-dependent methyltransferase
VYLNAIRPLVPSLAGKTVLEVGPGINYGCVMILAAYGARPAVVDRFLAPWEPGYHRRFYSRLREELVRRAPEADVRPLEALVEADGYPEAVIARCESPLETIPLSPESIDLVLSNAVVEHLFDLEKSFAQLYRITRPGGFGLHQVDFRDHRDFDRPLEFLLQREEDFQAEFARTHGEIGNRYRPDEVGASIRAAGFEVLGFEGNTFTRPEYLQEFLPRLRMAVQSRYHQRAAEDLHVVSGRYQLRKPAR